MTGVMRKRAKTGMTIPAAPSITSVSDREGERVALCIQLLCQTRHDNRNG